MTCLGGDIDLTCPPQKLVHSLCDNLAGLDASGKLGLHVARIRHSAKQIINELREAEVLMGTGDQGPRGHEPAGDHSDYAFLPPPDIRSS